MIAVVKPGVRGRRTCRRGCAKLRLCAAAVAYAFASSAPGASHATPDEASFDIGVLRSRGLDPKLARYFASAARFEPGTARVSLVVNGVSKGVVDATFGSDGRLCFTPQLLRRAGLVTPAALDRPRQAYGTGARDRDRPAPQQHCYDYRDAFAQTEVNLRPNEARVELLVPADALQTRSAGPSVWSSGGAAGMFNYDVQHMRTRGGTASTAFARVGTEMGVNVDDWIVRSRQSMIDMNGRRDFGHAGAYAQRTFVAYESVLQIGQINIAGSLSGGGALYGIQVLPEQALAAMAGSGVSVEGIAPSQARVEVRQSGALIYSTLTPAGPFRFDDLPVINTTSDLDVTVVGADGSQRHFTVPAASLMHRAPGASQGLSAAFGKLRDAAGAPWIATITRGWNVGRRATLVGSATLTDEHRGVAGGFDFAPLANTAVNTRLHLTHHTADRSRGVQASIGVSTRATEGLSASLSASASSAGFRSSAVVGRQPRSCGAVQYAASLGYASPTYGAFSLGYTQSEWGRARTSRRIAGAWATTIGRASASFSVECNATSRGRPVNAMYVNVSLPMGKHSVGTQLSMSGERLRTGTRVSGAVGEQISYSASVSARPRERDASADLSLGVLPRYAQLGLGASFAPRMVTYSSSARGGIALHRHGLTFSPYPIRDTFAVVSVGDLAGVRVVTPDGPVWTDWSGRAAVPSLAAFSPSQIQVATTSLPRNVDIDSGVRHLSAARGAVGHVEFDVTRVRRVLLDVRLPDGAPVRRGATVVDDRDRLVTIVADDGRLFLDDAKPGTALRVAFGDGRYCALEYALSGEPSAERYYDVTSARCVPQ